MTEQIKLTKQDIKEDQPKVVSGEWMNLEEASDAMGMSSITLRRYAKKGTLKWRRLGKSRNAKIQVYVTPELLAETEEQRISTEGLDEVLDGDQDVQVGEWDASDEAPTEQPLRDTLHWLQETITEKDRKIHELSEKLMAATHRNGYLESEIGTAKEQLKLITQTPDQVDGIDQAALSDQAKSKITAWRAFISWFTGAR
jgi:DNA-binding transcriptional MerR regulator